MIIMKEDWRLLNQKNYLYREKLIKKKFKATEQCDHVHCEFCWDKFGELEDMLHDGYCVDGETLWICETCFHDFKEDFEWTVSFPQ